MGLGSGVVWGLFDFLALGNSESLCHTNQKRLAAVTSALPAAPAVPWIWDSVGSVSLGVLSPSFQGFVPWPVTAGAEPALPAGLGLDVLLGLWFFIGFYGVCGRERCWMIFREEIEVLDMMWSLMALLRSEILQANSSYFGAFKCFLGGERLSNITFKMQ